ncbi:MAG: hypothetical protein AVDCRST_MAG38-2794 [uncultured Solirubrobacteraceae bacterium]|uniref:ER-bound oxygenase mpaB/mpaB'/Rubber oxygenase catalytic domain-containing protein n=1 Tax=uncultured Solirubrobacteraceae bacterium TaxID=1162706 RepID=A0A6J4SH07_9ACTN|nr:MAG: hypothetical protein AVDCRST_MAG38-2794 [uncultured Solirubrobacteraceae bacterium]
MSPQTRRDATVDALPARWAHAADPGLFGPGSVTWKVNREGVLLLGGGRALLLQVAHPSVAAGVSAHSRYDVDPWGRLLRTLRVVTLITFGDGATSAAAARALRARHASVRGTRSDGAAYRATEPELLLWVWATLVQSSLLVYTRCVGDLTPAEIEAFHGEQRRFAVACGVPGELCPPDYEAFADYFDGMVATGLTVGSEARRIAAAVLRPPVPTPLSVASLPSFELLRLMTTGLLPPNLRADYGLGWGPLRERAFRLATDAARHATGVLPARLRQLPLPA